MSSAIRKSWVELLFLLTSLTALGACQRDAANGSRDGDGFGAEQQIAKGMVQRSIVADGNLYSPSSMPLVVQRIRWYWDYNISWTADEGSLVKAGDPVLRLDPTTIQKDLDEKELSLAQQKLDLQEEELRGEDEVADTKAGVTTAEFDLKKEELLISDSDAVSETEKKRQRLKVASARAALRRAREKVEGVKLRSSRKVESQKIRVKKAEEEVTEMRTGIEKTEMKAPQDGLVIFPLYSSNAGWLKARPGSGVQVNTVVAEIANPSDLVARLYVPEIDADGLVEGTPGVMTLDIMPGKTFPGKIKSVASVPSTAAERDGNKSPKPADNVRQFEILFAVDSLPAQAMPGMTVQAVLRPIEKDGVLRVPTEALATAIRGGKKNVAPVAAVPDASAAPGTDASSDKEKAKAFAGGTEAYVYVKAKSGETWEWRQVKLGAQSLTYAEVLEGLNEGDRVKMVLW